METSVEFLERMFKSFNIITSNDLKRAKKLEKQQIIDAHLNGQAEFDTESYRYEVIKNAEQYYKETFKKK